MHRFWRLRGSEFTGLVVPGLIADQVLASMPVGYMVWDSQWKCVELNLEGARLVGYTEDYARGRTFGELFPGMVGTDLEAAYLRVAETCVSESLEVAYPAPIDRWLDIRIVGGPGGVSAFFFDYTSRRHRADALAHSAERSKADARALAEAMAKKEDATARAVMLSEVAIELTAADSVRRLEEIVVGRGLPVLGADGGAVISRAADGDWRVTVNAAFGDHVQVIYGSVPSDSPLPACWSARTGERLLLPDRVAGLQFHSVMQAVYDDTACDGWAFLPLLAGDRRLGSLAMSWVHDHHVDQDELSLLAGFAAQCAQALLRIEIAEAQRAAASEVQQLAESLQQALLTPPPKPDHLHIAVRYRPAGHHAQVGGDWYDAFLQPDGATILVIGDVVGHDSVAAAKMGQIRGVLRTLAYDSEPSDMADTPAAIVTRLEHSARGLAVDTLATTIVARIEQPQGDGTRQLRWTNAGHPPPVLLLADGTTEMLDTKPDLMLGVDANTERHDHLADLPDGSTLLLFTDGLIERRDESAEISMDALRSAIVDLATTDVEQFCDTLLTRLDPDANEDDTALLAVRTNPANPHAHPGASSPAHLDARPAAARAPASSRAMRTLPAGPEAASYARQFVLKHTATLPRAVRDDAELLVSEIVTNAVRYGRPPVTLRVRREPDALTVLVTDHSPELPTFSDGQPDLTAPSGRGLLIVAATADAWGVTPEPNGGKTVWFELS